MSLRRIWIISILPIDKRKPIKSIDFDINTFVFIGAPGRIRTGEAHIAMGTIPIRFWYRGSTREAREAASCEQGNRRKSRGGERKKKG